MTPTRSPRPTKYNVQGPGNYLEKPDLALLVHKRTGCELNLCLRVVDNFVEVVHESLANGTTVKLRGLGSLRLRPTPSQKVHLPEQPDHWVELPAGKRVVFVPCDALGRALRGKARRIPTPEAPPWPAP